MPIGFALAETGRTRKLYGASTGAHQFQRSSVVERSAVNRLVVGSNPTAGVINRSPSAALGRTDRYASTSPQLDLLSFTYFREGVLYTSTNLPPPLRGIGPG
jgi:hypothetical protein